MRAGIGAEMCVTGDMPVGGTGRMAQMMSNHDTAANAPAADEVNALLDELQVSPESNLIGVLQQVQDRFGYLPPCALDEISLRTKQRLSRVYGVVSFYAQFYTEPRGKHTVRCCRGTACHVKGSQRVIHTVEKLLGVKEGETTPDMNFYLEAVACLGACFLAPAMMIDGQYFGKLTPKRVETILRTYGAQECSDK
ncbi:MAG: NAD(P)H-dependent oxidoreductase subunit E [Armatimonadetes bacterium]|nr:NAD(P)H-dependent oxidoreductase subunit E [Armatimonadota bacterium]